MLRVTSVARCVQLVLVSLLRVMRESIHNCLQNRRLYLLVYKNLRRWEIIIKNLNCNFWRM